MFSAGNWLHLGFKLIVIVESAFQTTTLYGPLLFSVNHSSAGDFGGSRSSANEVVIKRKKQAEKQTTLPVLWG